MHSASGGRPQAGGGEWCARGCGLTPARPLACVSCCQQQRQALAQPGITESNPTQTPTSTRLCTTCGTTHHTRPGASQLAGTLCFTFWFESQTWLDGAEVKGPRSPLGAPLPWEGPLYAAHSTTQHRAHTTWNCQRNQCKLQQQHFPAPHHARTLSPYTHQWLWELPGLPFPRPSRIAPHPSTATPLQPSRHSDTAGPPCRSSLRRGWCLSDRLQV